MKNLFSKLLPPFLTFFPPFLIFTLPLFFLPVTLSFFQTNKLLLLIASTVLLLTTTALGYLSQHKLHHLQSAITWPLAIFWLVTIINLILTQEARFESLTGTGAIFLILPVLAYFLTNSKSFNLRWSLLSLIGVGTLLALLGIAQLVLIADLASVPAWLQSYSFTPAGSILSLLIVLVVSCATALIWGLKEENLSLKTGLFTAAAVQVAAGLAYITLIVQGQKINLKLLPIQAGWSIALDSLKAGRQLLVGVGLANFPVLYTNFKPASLAQTDLWAAIFNRSSTELLHLISTMGLTGLLAFILLLLAGLRLVRQLSDTALDQALKTALVLLIISFVVLPANVVTYGLFFILLAVAARRVTQPEDFKTIPLPNYARYSSTTLLAALALVSSYFTYRVYAAERAMFQAQQALAQNNANAVYQNHVHALKLTPQNTNYHSSFAQINLQLASSLSQTQNQQNQEAADAQLTDQQRQQISTLVQRAIEQGRITTQLRPSYFNTWQILGYTYRNLINVAQGAENFALQNYQQAVQLNPTDPSLRIEYGGLFYQLAGLISAQQQAQQQVQQQSQQQIDPETIENLLDQAIQQFKTAVSLRPTHANAYYNLAKAHEAKEDYRSAYQAMQLTLANLEPDSADYQTAQKELLALEKKLPQTQEAAAPQTPVQEEKPTNLQQPKPLPSPLPGGPIELPGAEAELEEATDSATQP